jgi:ketosteroid isomerase-like protein
MSGVSNLETARRYIASLASSAGLEDLEEFLGRDFVQEEFPNRFSPRGSTSDLQQTKEARARGQALLKAESFEVVGAVASADEVALEVKWTGTVSGASGPFTAGQVLRARFAIFLEFNEGRITKQRNYDCFESW